MNEKKFDPKKLQKLNNPKRLLDIPPERISSLLDIDRAEIIVEIGAGTGFFSIAFLEQLAPARLYACDISSIMLDWMREHVVPRYPAIIPMLSREETVPLNNGVADLVFMINLQHELDKPLLILKEAYRLLKPGGTVLVVDWKKEDMDEGPPASIRCLPETVGEQMRAAGFAQVRDYQELEKHFLVIGNKSPSADR